MGRALRILCAWVGLASVHLGAEPVTMGTLLREMVDLDGLARFPDPAFRTIQFSSFDRRARSPGAPGWFSNSDGFGREPIPGFLRVLREPGPDGVGVYLMAEVDGPGAIVRGWTAAIEGRIRAFLDGEEAPVFDGLARAFLADRYAHYARGAGIDPEPVGDAFRQEDADYFPIPFAKGCRIEWEGRLDRLHFYHINVRRYREGTRVVTFRPDDVRTFAGEIRKVTAILRDPARLEPPAGGGRIRGEEAIAAGARLVLWRREGEPAAIRLLRLRVEADDREGALRGTILQVRFDGARRPQVEAPVGDFFGAGPGVTPYRSLPMSVEPDGTMTCRFVMPFARSVEIGLVNLTDEPVRARWEIDAAAHAWDAERTMHFRARWRVDHGLEAAPAACDLPYLIAFGRGAYVGSAAMIMNPSPIPTAAGNWWGEGDEKVFVDGEAFPSTFGTGSEDYYNYSWSRCALFAHPYCAQPLDTGPDTRGYVANIRWHILDRLPFERGIAFYMELYAHNPTPGLSYARIGYHYGRPGLYDDALPIKPSDARVPPLPAAWRPLARGAARGAIFHQAEDLARRGEGAEIVEGALWSAGKLLLWRPAKAGDRLTLTLPVEKTGRYAVVLTAALGPSAGRFRLRCDGEVLSGRQRDGVDLFAPSRPMLRNLFFGPVRLEAGAHALELEAAGAAPASRGSEVGIDFTWIRPR